MQLKRPQAAVLLHFCQTLETLSLNVIDGLKVLKGYNNCASNILTSDKKVMEQQLELKVMERQLESEVQGTST